MIHIAAKIKKEAKWHFSNPATYTNKCKGTGMRFDIITLTYKLFVA